MLVGILVLFLWDVPFLICYIYIDFLHHYLLTYLIFWVYFGMFLFIHYVFGFWYFCLFVASFPQVYLSLAVQVIAWAVN